MNLVPSEGFAEWLAQSDASLVFSSYHSSRLFLVGTRPEGGLSYRDAFYDRCMGLCTAGTQTLWIGGRAQFWRLENLLSPGHREGIYDRIFAPQVALTTADVRAHDLGLDENGRPIFVNTLYSCLARADEATNFCFLWKPPFIRKISPDDACHLNGMAMENGRPRFVTACRANEGNASWRQGRRHGGVVISVPDGEIVTSDLSMPHSPRLHRGALYVLNSGRGEFGRIDLKSGKFEPICFCPGFARGLAFCGRFAILGLSACRVTEALDHLQLDEELTRRGLTARCGLMVVDLESGRVEHTLDIQGDVSELYDVVVLEGVKTPAAYTFEEFTRKGLTISADPLTR